MPRSWIFHFLVMEKSWKINVEKEGSPWSHAGIVSKQLKISLNFFICSHTTMVFTILHYCFEILTGRGACHSGGLRNFRSDNAEQWQCCKTLRPADTFTPSAYDTAVRRRSTCRYFSSLRMISRRAGFSASAELLVYLGV